MSSEANIDRPPNPQQHAAQKRIQKTQAEVDETLFNKKLPNLNRKLES